jgi:methylglutaconyl-CoA hydratase
VAIGLLNRAVPRADLDAAISSTLKELLRGGPHAQALGKQAMGALVRRGLADQTGQMAAFFRRCLDDPEVDEGAAAFLQKRPATWTR